MKIIQVSTNFVMENLKSDNIYRIMLCDDTKSTASKKHYSARIKPLKNLSVEELNESLDNAVYGFILIEQE